ncbi:MAG TPA: GtrA family protein [Steroidobacteraceae bacterium]|nr:GtrA family protein [Steroidobacteraceae bacterium]
MTPDLKKLCRDLVGYGLVSALALALDAGLLLALTRYAGLHYQLAAALSFSAGALLAWWLSSRWVFSQHQLANRGTELLAFVGLGLVGLVVNAAVLGLAVQWLHWPLLAGKFLAVGGTFFCNFILRRQLLFTAHEVRP